MATTNGRTRTAAPPAPATDQLEPHNVEAELAVLGSISIRGREAIFEISHLELTAADFFIERHGWVFEAMLEIDRAGQPIDGLTLAERLKERGQLESVGGPAFITGLINDAPYSTNIAYYAEMVKNYATRNRVIDFCKKEVEHAYDTTIPIEDLVSDGARAWQEIAAGQGGERGDTVDEILLNEVDPLYQRARQNPNEMTGLSTTLTDLDKVLRGGLHPREVYILAGRPGMGKTTLALQIAWAAARNRAAPALFFSLEMDRAQLTRKILSFESGVPSNLIESGRVSDEEAAQLNRAMETLHAKGRSLRIIDDATLTPERLRSDAIAHWARQGLDLIVIDYLQLMISEKRAENRQAEVSGISRAVKALAGELDVPIVALSQLNRSLEARHDKRPMLSDLRESGALEQDCDVAMFLYRDEVYNPDTEFPNVAEISVLKHRVGETGIMSAFFKKRVSKFADLKIANHQLEY